MYICSGSLTAQPTYSICIFAGFMWVDFYILFSSSPLSCNRFKADSDANCALPALCHEQAIKSKLSVRNDIVCCTPLTPLSLSLSVISQVHLSNCWCACLLPRQPPVDTNACYCATPAAPLVQLVDALTHSLSHSDTRRLSPAYSENWMSALSLIFPLLWTVN